MSTSGENSVRSFYPNAIAMTIAGSDPSGGAGLQADLKTFQQLGVYGATAITLVTIQNTQKVSRIETLAPQLVIDQIDAIVSDISVAVAKTGALGDASIIEAVAKRAETFNFPLVVDPVIISKHKTLLLDDASVAAYRSLIAKALIVTPNKFELEKLTGIELTDEQCVAQAIYELHMMGAKYVLVKMGEINGESQHIFGDGQQNLAINVNRFDTPHTHGAGCVLSAAITALLAKGNEDILDVVHQALNLVLEAVYNAQPLGKGNSPVETRVMQCKTAEV